MTRLRNLVMGGAAALAIVGAANSAFAEETGTFQNRLNGATIGIPAGAAPPPGIYTGLLTAYLGTVGSGGASIGNQCALVAGKCAVLPAVAQGFPVVFAPGWNFLGGTYLAVVAQAFYVYTTCGPVPCGLGQSNSGIVGGGYVAANTFWNPITLSWNLGGGWFVSVGFNFTAPDGTKANAGFTPNPDYWTFEPAWAISYLGNNWVASANMYYDFNTQSAGTCCAATKITSGDAFYADLTATYKFGKWQFGPVGYTEIQTSSDSGPGCPALCGKYTTAAAGVLVGYDFGPVDLQAWVTDSFVGNDTPQGSGGVNVWTRLGFRLWAPEAPKPLVAKN